MDLVDYLRILRRRWRVLAATLVLAVLAAWVTTPDGADSRVPAPTASSYIATHTLLQAPDVQSPPNLELTRLFATRGNIPRRAAVRLGLPAEQGPMLAMQVDVAVDPKVGSLTVTSSGTDGERAARTANAFALEIIENLRATLQKDRDAERSDARNLVVSLGARIAQLEEQIANKPPDVSLLQAQRDAYLTNYTSAFSRLQSLSEQGAARSPLISLEEAVPIAVVTSSPFAPPSSRGGRIALAALVGLLLGVVLALVLERVDRRLRSREAVEDITSLPVVAEVPVLPRRSRRDWSIQVVSAPAGAVAEAYRSLRSAVMLVPSRPALQQTVREVEWQAPEVLLVTSPLPADGKTTTVANLAACLAESGRQVLVLDCDFRNPTLHRYLRVQPGPGMSDLLAGTSVVELAHVVRASAVPGVRMVTSGTVTGHPAALLARAGALLDTARQLADIVLIDAAPVLAANDATDLVPYVDGVVLVTRSGRTTREHALRTTELLARLSVPIAGTVLVGSDASVGRYSFRTAGRLGFLGAQRRRPASHGSHAWQGGVPPVGAEPRHPSGSAPGPVRHSGPRAGDVVRVTQHPVSVRTASPGDTTLHVGPAPADERPDYLEKS